MTAYIIYYKEYHYFSRVRVIVTSDVSYYPVRV